MGGESDDLVVVMRAYQAGGGGQRFLLRLHVGGGVRVQRVVLVEAVGREIAIEVAQPGDLIEQGGCGF